MAQGVHSSERYKHAVHACPFDPRWAPYTGNALVLVPFWESGIHNDGSSESIPHDIGYARHLAAYGTYHPVWSMVRGDLYNSFYNWQGATDGAAALRYWTAGELAKGATAMTVAMRVAPVGQSTWAKKHVFCMYDQIGGYRMLGLEYAADSKNVFFWVNNTTGMSANGPFSLNVFEFLYGINLFDGDFHSVVLTWAGNGGFPDSTRELWIDGLLAGISNSFWENAGPLVGTRPEPMHLWLGATPVNNKQDRGLLGSMSFFGMWPRFWHPGEIRAWSADPFGMVRPMARPPGPPPVAEPPLPPEVCPLDWFDPETGEAFSAGAAAADWQGAAAGADWFDGRTGPGWRGTASGSGWFDPSVCTDN